MPAVARAAPRGGGCCAALGKTPSEAARRKQFADDQRRQAEDLAKAEVQGQLEVEFRDLHSVSTRADPSGGKAEEHLKQIRLQQLEEEIEARAVARRLEISFEEASTKPQPAAAAVAADEPEQERDGLLDASGMDILDADLSGLEGIAAEVPEDLGAGSLSPAAPAGGETSAAELDDEATESEQDDDADFKDVVENVAAGRETSGQPVDATEPPAAALPAAASSVVASVQQLSAAGSPKPRIRPRLGGQRLRVRPPLSAEKRSAAVRQEAASLLEQATLKAAAKRAAAAAAGATTSAADAELDQLTLLPESSPSWSWQPDEKEAEGGHEQLPEPHAELGRKPQQVGHEMARTPPPPPVPQRQQQHQQPPPSPPTDDTLTQESGAKPELSLIPSSGEAVLQPGDGLRPSVAAATSRSIAEELRGRRPGSPHPLPVQVRRQKSAPGRACDLCGKARCRCDSPVARAAARPPAAAVAAAQAVFAVVAMSSAAAAVKRTSSAGPVARSGAPLGKVGPLAAAFGPRELAALAAGACPPPSALHGVHSCARTARIIYYIAVHSSVAWR
eukprot:SAG22_NODE_130_length_18670_cov_12.091379_15_plen_562_part_00